VWFQNADLTLNVKTLCLFALPQDPSPFQKN